MTGTTYDNPGGTITYYRCPHNPATPKHAADHPDHPRTVQAPEALLDRITGQFFATRIFGPGRAALLAAQLPATDADAAAERDAAAARRQGRLKRIETAQDSCILGARTARRRPGRHRGRRHARPDPCPVRRPLLGDILPGLPPALKACPFAAFGIEILWNKPGQQVTVFAEITGSTVKALPGLTDPGQDGYHNTSPKTSNDAPRLHGHLNNTPRSGRDSTFIDLGEGFAVTRM